MARSADAGEGEGVRVFGRRISRAAACLALALAASLGYFLTLVAIPFDADQIFFAGDQADLVRRAERILGGTLLLTGHYSVSGPDHPGPLYSYLHAALLGASGGEVAGLYFLTSLLKSLWMIPLALALLPVVRSAWLAAALPLLALGAPTVLGYTKILWAPAMTLPFMALAVWLALGVTRDRRRALLPWLAFVLSVLVQTHTAQLAVAAGLAAPIAIAALRTARAKGWREIGKPVGFSIGVALLLWSPPLYEAFRNDGGNLAALYELHSQPGAGRSWTDVVHAIFQLTDAAFPGPAWLWLAVFVSGLLCATIRLLQAFLRDDACGWFPGMALSLTAAFGLSLLRVPDELRLYYLTPFYIICILLAGIACGVLADCMRGAWSGRTRGLLAALCAGAAGLSLASDLPRHAGADWNPYPFGQMRAVVQAIATDAAGRPMLLHARGALAQPTVPALLYFLDRSAVNVALPPAQPEVVYSFYNPASDGEQVPAGRVLVRTPAFLAEKRAE